MSYANMDGVPTQTAGTSELLASDWNTYVRDNFDSIKFGHIVCTSSTRPTGIAEGTMIYETDTNKVLVYSGSSWIEVNDLDSTDGVTASAQSKLDDVSLIHVATETVSGATYTTGTIFSSTYDHYMCILNNVSGTGSLELELIRSSGSEDTDGWYGATYQGATPSGSADSYSSKSNEATSNTVSRSTHASIIYVFSPMLAQTTMIMAHMTDYGNAERAYRATVTYLGNAQTHDKLKIVPTSGTMSGGTLRVYGFRNS